MDGQYCGKIFKETIIFDDTKMNTVQIGTMMATRHPMKARRHTRPMTMAPANMIKVIAKAVLKTVLKKKLILGVH